MAIYTLSSNDFNVPNMGKAALKSHVRGGKHTKLMEREANYIILLLDLWSTNSKATVVSCPKCGPLETERRPLPTAGKAKTAYNNYLAEEKYPNVMAQRTQQRKTVLDKLDGLKNNKRCTEGDIKLLEPAADKFAEAVERNGDLKIIAKFNVMRRSLEIKQQEPNTLELNIKEKVNAIRSSQM